MEAKRSLTAARQLTEQRDRLSAEREQLQAALAGLKGQHDRLRTERDYMLKSVSWRSTAPLRAVRSLLRRRNES